MKKDPNLLVILRLGPDHRVSSWAKTSSKARGWDLLLSPYDTVRDIDEFEADYLLPIKGGKWDAIHTLLADRPDLLDKYDYFWLPDDDIEAFPTCPNELQRIAESQGIQLCQPALHADSQFSHLITIRNRFTSIRYTNFVELMAPFMTSDILRKAAPYMQGRWAAPGLDYFWHRFVSGSSNRSVAVIDSIQVGHYRPKGRHLEGRRQCKQSGEDSTLPCLFENEASRGYCPLSLGTGNMASRVGMTGLSILNLVASPALWKRENTNRILTHLAGQLFVSDWQGTREPPIGKHCN